MKLKAINTGSMLLALLLAVPAAQAASSMEFGLAHLQLDLTGAAPAADLKSTGGQLSVGGRFDIAGPLFAQGEFSRSITDGDGTVGGAPMQVDEADTTQERINLGFALPLDGGEVWAHAGYMHLGLRTTLINGLGVSSTSQDSSDGYSAHGGIRGDLAPWAQIWGEAGYLKLSDYAGPEVSLGLRFKTGPVWLAPSARYTRLTDNGGAGPKNEYKAQELRLSVYFPIP